MNKELVIRPYTVADKDVLMHLLALNTPTYFAPEEAEDFSHYLQHEREQYFVVEKDQKIVGCGGINFLENGTEARISWDMIHPSYQGQAIGKHLLQYRLEIIKNLSQVEKIVVRTTQLVFPFYEKKGFELIRIEQDYWAPGFDLYQMELLLTSNH